MTGLIGDFLNVPASGVESVHELHCLFVPIVWGVSTVSDLSQPVAGAAAGQGGWVEGFWGGRGKGN
jgi:hypothetical protein